MTRLYLDASVLIYSVEGGPIVKSRLIERFQPIEDGGGSFLTSSLTRLEVRVRPLREQDQTLLARYESLLNRKLLEISEIDHPTLDLAADLRARYRFKTPDAIHLATAMLHRADRFLTGDRTLQRCEELHVELVDPA